MLRLGYLPPGCQCQNDCKEAYNVVHAPPILILDHRLPMGRKTSISFLKSPCTSSLNRYADAQCVNKISSGVFPI
jgi:hypothetical protein